MAPVAKEFDKIIKDGRERKKNEALASQIFSKNRRQSAPSKLKAGAGPSLASRVGVRKIPQRAITSGRRASVPAGNVNGEWTHDLHGRVNGGGAGKKPATSSTATQGLGWRVSLTEPSVPVSRRAAARKAKMVAAAADIMDVDSGSQVKGKAGKAARSQVNLIAAPPQGISIRGLAGPFAVIGQNFAPGTTPADVESAMSPIGGEMVSCKVVKSHPFLMMEMVFSSKEGGERVIDIFNNKTADGRILKIYPKVGGYQPNTTNSNSNSDTPANAPTGPKASRNQQQQGGNSQVVDGTMGFSNSGAMQANSNNNSRSGGSDLFSDKMITSKRGGRGGRRGGRS